MDLSLKNDLSRVLHELWRAQRTREGWTPGPFRPDSKSHDALVPFEKLGRGDRLAMALHIEAEELETSLVKSIEYFRGPNRPLLIEEMTEGMEVAFMDPDTFPELATSRGTVITWQTEGGELISITVRWKDGEVASYSPWERVLARPSELQ